MGRDGYCVGRLARDGGQLPGSARGLDCGALIARIDAAD